MREINCKDITEAVARLSIESNCFLNSDIYNALKEAKKEETSPVGQEFLDQLIKNAEIARDKNMPICQDTGVAVIFIEMGQEVHITGGNITDAVNEGVRKGYIEGFLRKSVVEDPV